jgi:hypothetical protein
MLGSPRHRLIGLLVGLVAWGCAGTRMQEVVVYHPTPAQPFTRFLVVGVHENGRTRRLFENAFVAELGKQGVQGVQSHKSIYEERAITLPNVERAIRETGADALITVRVLDAHLQPKPDRPAMRESLAFDLLSENPDRRLLPKPDQVSLRVNVFHTATRQLVLSAFPRSVRPESVEEIAHEVCQETVEALARESLIARR